VAAICKDLAAISTAAVRCLNLPAINSDGPRNRDAARRKHGQSELGDESVLVIAGNGKKYRCPCSPQNHNTSQLCREPETAPRFYTESVVTWRPNCPNPLSEFSPVPPVATHNNPLLFILLASEGMLGNSPLGFPS
jgi:hypothetical protein